MNSNLGINAPALGQPSPAPIRSPRLATLPGPTPSPARTALLSVPVKAWSTAEERDRTEALADLYSILVTTEQLERAYVRDLIHPVSEYTTACQKLITQYKTLLASASVSSEDVQAFVREYDIHCPAAMKRLWEIGIPATIEHGDGDAPFGQTASSSLSGNLMGRGSASLNAKAIADTVQYFITLMDSIKLNYTAVDQIHPQLSDIMSSLAKLKWQKQLPGRERLKEWLIRLNKMKASDNIDEEQVRQLLFDLETCYTEFQNALHDGAHS